MTNKDASIIAIAVAKELRKNWGHLYQFSRDTPPEFPSWNASSLATHFEPTIRRTLKRIKKAKGR